MLQSPPAEAANGWPSYVRPPAEPPTQLRRSPILPTLVGLCAALCAALFLHSRVAHAQAGNSSPSALVVFGKADPAMQEVVYNVVDRLLRNAGWPLVPPLASNEATIVRGCLVRESPWPCLESMASRKGIQRIVAVRVELERSPDGTSQIVLTGRLVYAGSSSVLEQKRYCGACSKEDLTAYAEEISKDLLDDRAVAAGTTKVGVSSSPMGAEVRIDGKVVGVTNNIFNTFPGKHTVEVRAPGYQAKRASVTAIDGKTVVALLTLDRAAPGANPNAPPVPAGGAGSGDVVEDGSGGESMFRKWGPKGMVAVGGVMVVTGAILIALDEDQVDDNAVEQDYFDSALGGTVLTLSGAVFAGAGGYLWWKYSSSTSTPTIATTSSGVVLGLAGSF